MDEPARRLVGLEVGDEPSAWRRAGFTVVEDRITVGGVTLRLSGAGDGRGLRSASLEPPVAGDVDGLPLVAADPGVGAEPRVGVEPGVGADGDASDGPAHDNGVVAVDHVVVASGDVERTTAALATHGLTPRRTVVGARGDGDDEVVYRFFLLGTCVLELVGPAHGGGGPARFTGLAFTTERIDELGELAGTPRDAVQPGRRIATLRGRDLGISVPTAFLTPRPARHRGR